MSLNSRKSQMLDSTSKASPANSSAMRDQWCGMQRREGGGRYACVLAICYPSWPLCTPGRRNKARFMSSARGLQESVA